MPRTAGISPKLLAAVFMAVFGYLATQELVDFPSWADLLIQVGLVGGGVWVANPGEVVTQEPGATSDRLLDPDVVKRLRQEDGYTLVDALLIVFLCIVILAVLLRVL